MTGLTRGVPRALLARLIDMPDLPAVVRELPPMAFAALVRKVGVEDAGEVVALATTEQLVAAFDEDLFKNDRPGERETFDPDRFIVWLEVLLEAGDGVAAARFAELSEELVVRALTSVLIVLDEEALRHRMSEDDVDADAADKAIEASLSEEIDGYLLIARRTEGWDAVIALILALDRDHRPLLERLLDHAARLSGNLVEDLDELVTALSEGDSLAEDVEAEREDRRAARGYVEPRAARAFLELAKRPLSDAKAAVRDPITRAYFRELSRDAPPTSPPTSPRLSELVGELVGELAGAEAPAPLRLPSAKEPTSDANASSALTLAMQRLRDVDAARFEERLEELVYLANVLVAGGTANAARYSVAQAAASVLDTVTRGAELSLGRTPRGVDPIAPLVEVLRTTSADLLFRRASSADARGKR
jgi:hypothetical protein